MWTYSGRVGGQQVEESLRKETIRLCMELNTVTSLMEGSGSRSPKSKAPLQFKEDADA